jgi:hypothetical protein
MGWCMCMSDGAEFLTLIVFFQAPVGLGAPRVKTPITTEKSIFIPLF